MRRGLIDGMNPHALVVDEADTYQGTSTKHT